MYEISNQEEFDRAINSNRVVFVLYYWVRKNKETETFIETLKKLEEKSDPEVLFCSVDVNKLPALAPNKGSRPLLKVYYDGKVVFEQEGCLTDVDLNTQAVRRGLRSVFAQLQVKVRF